MATARDMFINAMRQVASTVTVVTTDGPAGQMGATVSAFTSLSADPPSVLVCLKTNSRIAQAVAGNGVFCVNILSEDHDDIALRFSGAYDDKIADRFAGLDVIRSDEGPLLPQATSFTCTLNKQLVHGSHTICIGGVLGIADAGHRPLTYMQGNFHVVRPKTNG